MGRPRKEATELLFSLEKEQELMRVRMAEKFPTPNTVPLGAQLSHLDEVPVKLPTPEHLKDRAALYARVSTKSQSVENQLSALRKYADYQGFSMVGEYSDSSISGAEPTRGGLNSLLYAAKNGEFGRVLVTAYDRVARDTKLFLHIIDILNGCGVEVVSMREPIDLSGPMGRYSLTMVAAIAELEASSMSQRIKLGMAMRKQTGLPVGRQKIDIDHGLIVEDRKTMSLTDIAEKHKVSRTSVVRWVREQRELDEVGV
jgi:putative DNA-invertase from lambdoid prophage Rac